MTSDELRIFGIPRTSFVILHSTLNIQPSAFTGEPSEREARRFLFRLFLRPSSRARQGFAAYHHVDVKYLSMVGTFFPDQAILGQRPAARLQPLLERRLVILPEHVGSTGGIDGVLELAPDER